MTLLRPQSDCHDAGFYEKDKATPVDPRFVPKFDDVKLASFPEGYRYLAYGQSSAYKVGWATLLAGLPH